MAKQKKKAAKPLKVTLSELREIIAEKFGADAAVVSWGADSATLEIRTDDFTLTIRHLGRGDACRMASTLSL